VTDQRPTNQQRHDTVCRNMRFYYASEAHGDDDDDDDEDDDKSDAQFSA